MITADRVQLVREIFQGTAASYDVIVEQATRGADRKWKEAVLAHIDRPHRVLDLACGTRILTRMILERFPDCTVVGADAQKEYLDTARERSRGRFDSRVQFVLSFAEDLNLSGPFDHVTACYLPKYADLPRLLSRVEAMLTEGGRLIMQDFTYPRNTWVALVWERVFADLKEWANRACREAVVMLQMLPDVVRGSRSVEELSGLLRSRDFEHVAVERLSWGTSAIVSGRKTRAFPNSSADSPTTSSGSAWNG